jgi:phosphomannomutase
MKIDPFATEWQSLDLGALAESYGLDDWAKAFALGTAGYRDQLDPQDPANPKVPFNIVTLAIMSEAKARVFARKPASQGAKTVHVGGETRPNTPEFIAILARVYAANGCHVRLRAAVNTTPIWYSSFGVFYEECFHGDNLTASHSQYFKGGWKPLDSEGKQLVAEEAELVAEVKQLVATRATLKLAPWNSPNIQHDFDVDAAYVNFQRSVFGEAVLGAIQKAAAAGFHVVICPQGGSMKATAERLFPRLGIACVEYIYGEENSTYFKLGEVGGENYGADPGKPQIYRNIGAQKLLSTGAASVVFIWDPDGDRFNMVTKAPSRLAAKFSAIGLEVETSADPESCIVYFTPNQIYLMLLAHRIAHLDRSVDWFVALSVSTSRALEELAHASNIPTAQVKVGFKNMGNLAMWLEDRADPATPYVMPSGRSVVLGPKPRALLMCEESGGATLGGPELLMNKSATRGMIALREKDGMQLAVVMMSLAAHLYLESSSFGEYYDRVIEKNAIKYRFFHRDDYVLYDESLTGDARTKAKQQGVEKRDRIMSYFFSLTESAEAKQQLAAKLGAAPTLACSVGDGVLLEFDSFWCVVRASGTDAVVRYYIEGTSHDQIAAVGRALTSIDT